MEIGALFSPQKMVTQNKLKQILFKYYSSMEVGWLSVWVSVCYKRSQKPLNKKDLTYHYCMYFCDYCKCNWTKIKIEYFYIKATGIKDYTYC